jgi:hypothetical protein
LSVIIASSHSFSLSLSFCSSRLSKACLIACLRFLSLTQLGSQSGSQLLIPFELKFVLRLSAIAKSSEKLTKIAMDLSALAAVKT